MTEIEDQALKDVNSLMIFISPNADPERTEGKETKNQKQQNNKVYLNGRVSNGSVFFIALAT